MALRFLALTAGLLLFAGASPAAVRDVSVSASESISPTSAPPGGTATITFSATNTGTSAQTPFSLVLFLDSNWTVGEPPSGCSRPDPYTIDCESSTLGAGTATPTYAVTVMVNGSVQPGAIVNSRVIAFAGGTSGAGLAGDARSLVVATAPPPPPPPPPPSPPSPPPPTLSVTFPGGGSGTVTSEPGGITCNPSCSASFPAGTSITLTATPAAGSVFVNWGQACPLAGARTTCTLTINESTTVAVWFDIAPPTTTAVPPSPLPDCVVPALHALTLDAARARLRHGHCSLGAATRRASSAALVGRVVWQQVAPGRHLPHLAKVAVALGRRR